MKSKILVIDTTTSLVSPWKKTIAELYDMVEAIGGYEAITKLKETEFSAVIVNISLSTFNGIEAIRRIKSKYDKIPILVIANPTDEMGIKESIRLGVDDYVAIPVDVNILLQKISKHAKPLLKAEVKKPEVVSKKIEEAEISIPDRYYQGQSYFATGNYDKAIETFSLIVNEKKIKTDAWLRYIKDSLFQLARCLMKKNEIQKAIDTFTNFIQKYPTHEYVNDATFYIGECYEVLNQEDKALNFFKEVVQKAGYSSIATQAKKKIKSIEEKKLKK